MLKFFFYTGVASGSLALMIVLGMNWLYCESTSFETSHLFQSMESVGTVAMMSYFICAGVLWYAAFKRVRAEWEHTSNELKLARFLFLTLGMAFVGFFFYHYHEAPRSASSGG